MNDPMRKRDLPFPKHWLGYISIKFIVLAFAILLALHLAGMI
jgi:hypothetical protein